MSDELERLAGQADAVASTAPSRPGQAEPSGDPQAPPPTSPNLGAIAFLLTTFRTLAGAILHVQSLSVTLDDSKVELCAQVLAPVADKYGLDFSTAFAGPEAAALMVAGPILWEAAQQLKLELAAKRAKPVDGQVIDDGDASSSAGQG